MDCSGTHSTMGIKTNPWRCLCSHCLDRRQATDAIYTFARNRNRHHNGSCSFFYLKRRFTFRLNWQMVQNEQNEGLGLFYVRAHFLMNGLFKVLSIDNGTNFSRRIWCPIRCYNFNLWFTRIDTKTNEAENCEFCSKLSKTSLAYRPDDDSVDGFGLALGRDELESRWFDLFGLDCRFVFKCPKYDSPSPPPPPPPPLIVSSSGMNKSNFESSGAVISGTPGKSCFCCLDVVRFRRVGLGGSWNCVDRKSPYMRLINALFSSINSSIRSLFGGEKRKQTQIKAIHQNKNTKTKGAIVVMRLIIITTNN